LKRPLVAVVLALALTLTLSTSALAHICSNPNKPADKGSIGTLTFNVETEEETFVPSGKKGGGFITVVVVAPWGTQTYSVFAHAGPEGILPDGALNAGPGDNLCDGKGIDFAFQCFLNSIPAE
jgi:hypothetical protein